jgi:hypothetical protein
MKMTHETDVLKHENADLLPILHELQEFIHRAAQEGAAAHEVELAVWRKILELGRKVFGQFLSLVGSGDMGETVDLPDGRHCQRLDEKHRRRYVSIFGEFLLLRTVYGSREGQKVDFVPLDDRLQLPAGVFSYVLQDWDQALCVEEAFSQAERTLRRILGLQQSVDSLERMNVHMAQQVSEFRDVRSLPPAEEEGEIMISSADGKGIVMRRQEGEKASPTHRTKGEKASRKQMAIVGAVYTVDRYVRTPEEVVAALFGEQRPAGERPKPCHKQTMASLAYTDAEGTHSGIEATYTWIQEELWARNRMFVKEMVHLCDGQEALWEARQEHLPRRNTTDILDILHVTPRLWQAAHVFHGEGSTAATAFVQQRALKILQGQVDLVVRGLRQMGTKHGLTGSKQATLRKVCAYLENNRQRMRYDQYLAKGYPIASGVIEGACRHVVKDRMERAGMHWTRSGAQAMLDVRSIHVNGDWEAYQQYRIQRETIGLHPYYSLVEGHNFPLAA